MKKLDISIMTPDVNIMAMILIKIQEMIIDCPDSTMEIINYQDETSEEALNYLIARSIGDGKH